MKKYLIKQDRFYYRKRLKVQSTKACVLSKQSEYEAIRNEVLSNFQKISRSPKNIRLRKQHTLNFWSQCLFVCLFVYNSKAQVLRSSEILFSGIQNEKLVTKNENKTFREYTYKNGTYSC